MSRPVVPPGVSGNGRYTDGVIRISGLLVVGLLALTACGSDSDTTSQPTDDTASVEAGSVVGPADPFGFTTIAPVDAAAEIDTGPDDLVVLDVRTPEEFAEGHLDGALLVDFYSDDFAEQLAELDPDVPYVVYCRSGNRSGQTLPIMEQLGFASASDVDGGIVAWEGAGLPIVVD